MAEKKVEPQHVCQRCGKPWPDLYCPTCEALIQGEALEERGGVLAGNKHRPA